ncbi:Stp1/IreP family PP2C-type Ser/Thr phosphatase [Anaeromyxobacter sp. SG64]|uniref:Stp1/IreP family PP2C-type Ser/Thr phosphatase n=2 Tax=Anaeromyxobacter TaxID=161492 RepID=UPI001F597049|nr:Stp1/IreP family PP2C-type Ser/Thr phosphatase [Anaeromyxobacter sp. SG64]
MVQPVLLPVTAHGLTDVGRRRDHNEDALLVDDDLHLYVVADGMGGHAGGGTASRLAVETIQRTVRAARARTPGAFNPGSAESSALPGILRGAVEQACAVIYAAAQADPELAGMGTTATAVLVDGRSAFVAHVGDSRCYLLREGRIRQISEDHSLVAEQVKAGAITADEARNSRFKNIITRSVGFEREVKVDVMAFALAPRDAVVVCCDGLTNLVDDHEILRIVTEAPLAEAAARLVALANARGGDDNITVIVLRTGNPAGA